MFGFRPHGSSLAQVDVFADCNSEGRSIPSEPAAETLSCDLILTASKRPRAFREAMPVLEQLFGIPGVSDFDQRTSIFK